MKSYFTYETEIGTIAIAVEDGKVREISFGAKGDLRDETALHIETIGQIRRYLAGEIRQFDLPIAPQATPFMLDVYDYLLKIPYGSAKTYGAVASGIARPKAFRAVGMACNRNPIALVIPCHRVVGADGSLTGYAGGLDVKDKLLRLEGYLA